MAFKIPLWLMYDTYEDQADSSVHNSTYSPTLTLFAFHTNKKQSVYVYKLQIPKIHKNIQHF